MIDDNGETRHYWLKIMMLVGLYRMLISFVQTSDSYLIYVRKSTNSICVTLTEFLDMSYLYLLY